MDGIDYNGLTTDTPWLGLGDGRVYDPFVARFLSPDPFIPNATATQSYNRYSYCINKPLKYTDPSGFTQKPDDYEFKHGEGSSNMFNAPFFGAGYQNGAVDWSGAEAFFYASNMEYYYKTNTYNDLRSVNR